MMSVSRWKKAVAVAWIAAGLLAGAGICAHRAEAHVPAVCVALAGSPTVGTVEYLVVTLAHEGYSADETAAMIVGSVMAQCPEYWPVIERFAAAYSVPAAGVNL